MDALIRSKDKRYSNGIRVSNLHDTTYEDILKYFKKYKNARNVLLFRSPKHQNGGKGNGGAVYSRDEYLNFMEQNSD